MAVNGLLLTVDALRPWYPGLTAAAAGLLGRWPHDGRARVGQRDVFSRLERHQGQELSSIQRREPSSRRRAGERFDQAIRLVG